MTPTRRFCLSALTIVFLSPVFPTRAVTAAAAQPAAATEVRAVWVWGSTVRTKGAEAVAAQLRERGITDAILLVKGSAGTVSYPSAIAPPAGADDILGDFLTACHARGIKVHAWVNYHQDDYFGLTKTSKKYLIWHVAQDPAQPYPVTDGRICPLRAKEEYNDYFLSIVREILDRYPIDGIHLDYMRYPHAVYCFCPAHRAFAASQGIDVAHVRDLLQKTYYVPNDRKTYFNAVAAGDPDAVKWVGMRASEINGVVQLVKNLVDSHNAATGASVALSAALMPEGALSSMATDGARNDQFGLCHYAQKYEDFSQMMQFIAPMAYHKDYIKPPSWVGDVVAGAVAKSGGAGVLAGIQTYSVTSQDIVDALFAARWNGAAGFALFRYGASTSADQAWGAIVPTLDKLPDAMQIAFDQGWIDNAGVFTSLQQKVRNARKSLEASDAVTAQDQLAASLYELIAQSGRHIDSRTARILAFDTQWILDLMH